MHCCPTDRAHRGAWGFLEDTGVWVSQLPDALSNWSESALTTLEAAQEYWANFSLMGASFFAVTARLRVVKNSPDDGLNDEEFCLLLLQTAIIGSMFTGLSVARRRLCLSSRYGESQRCARLLGHILELTGQTAIAAVAGFTALAISQISNGGEHDAFDPFPFRGLVIGLFVLAAAIFLFTLLRQCTETERSELFWRIRTWQECIGQGATTAMFLLAGLSIVRLSHTPMSAEIFDSLVAFNALLAISWGGVTGCRQRAQHRRPAQPATVGSDDAPTDTDPLMPRDQGGIYNSPSKLMYGGLGSPGDSGLSRERE